MNKTLKLILIIILLCIGVSANIRPVSASRKIRATLTILPAITLSAETKPATTLQKIKPAPPGYLQLKSRELELKAIVPKDTQSGSCSTPTPTPTQTTQPEAAVQISNFTNALSGEGFELDKGTYPITVANSQDKEPPGLTDDGFT